MFIFKEELEDSTVATLIQAQKSVSYATAVESAVGDPHVDMGMILKNLQAVKASITDDDLYPTKSVLVSSNWNLNDDIFDNLEVWIARNTASHKPTNLEHEPHKIVGHITNCWAFDNDGNTLDDSAGDKLPDLFHVANGAVIYAQWAEDDLQERADELIKAIKAKEMCVSMECFFNGFDYGVKTPDGQYYITKRDSSTAFLTKHLRAYGGKGQYDGCKVGRVLRGIKFSGKGYVKKPANPYSEIFEDKPNFLFSKASTENPFKTHGGVFISTVDTSNSMEKHTMEVNLQIDALQKQVAELIKANEELKTSQAKKQIDELQGQITSLKASLEAAEKAKTEADTAIATAKQEAEAASKEKEEMKKKADEAEKAKSAAEEALAKVENEKTQANRVSTLVEGGFSKEEAVARVEKFKALSNEQFDVIAEDLVAAKKSTVATTTTDDDDDKTQDSADAGATTTVLDTAKPTENGVVTAGVTEDEGKTTREAAKAKLSSAFTEMFTGKKQEAAKS